MRAENKRIADLIAKQKLEYYKAIKNLHGSYTLLRKDRVKFGGESQRNALQEGNKNQRQIKAKGISELLSGLDAEKGRHDYHFPPNYFKSDVINRDIGQDFYFKTPYDNILGQGQFSEVRKLVYKKSKRAYAVKTFRLP